MIRYDISLADLWDRIRQHNTDWSDRAAEATRLFRQAGAYAEPGKSGTLDNPSWNNAAHGMPPRPFWGDIKRVYMKLQKNKCAFCERKLTERTKDHDVEHFRPKRAVKAWLPPQAPDYAFPTGDAFPEGYFRLAYHPLNYATSCEHCNRGLKRSYFPIEGTRISGGDTPEALAPELPLLLYPIGHIDSDPEDLIGFQGIIPVPKVQNQDAHENHRARVTIAFFDLEQREELRRERSRVIEHLWIAFCLEQSSLRARRRKSARIIARLTSEGSEHCNCARSFVALYRRDPQRAETLAERATEMLHSLDSP